MTVGGVRRALAATAVASVIPFALVTLFPARFQAVLGVAPYVTFHNTAVWIVARLVNGAGLLAGAFVRADAPRRPLARRWLLAGPRPVRRGLRGGDVLAGAAAGDLRPGSTATSRSPATSPRSSACSRARDPRAAGLHRQCPAER